MRWKAQLVVLGLNGRIRRTPGYAGGYLLLHFVFYHNVAEDSHLYRWGMNATSTEFT